MLKINKHHSNEIIKNNQIYYKYNIYKEFESGIVLLGWEVKSIRSKKIDISNSYISFNNNEAYICNALFQIINQTNNLIYNPIRMRKLLLTKQELLFLKEKIYSHKYTIVILNLFWKKSWIKAHIGLAKGKKKYDKRHIINTKQWKNEKRILIKTLNK